MISSAGQGSNINNNVDIQQYADVIEQFEKMTPEEQSSHIQSLYLVNDELQEGVAKMQIKLKAAQQESKTQQR